MLRIKVRYADEHGKTSEQLIETRSLGEMRAAFESRGYYILSEEAMQTGFADKLREAFSFERGVSVKELNEFTKLLRTLLHSGLPITEALEILLDGADDTPLNQALKQVNKDIREGVSFSKALARHTSIFPEIYVKTVVAGEKAGALENILKRLAEYFTNSIAIRRKVVSALIYPTILLTVSTAAVVYMLVAVVPEFIGLFESLNAPLPFITQLLVDVSGWLGTWFWLLLFAVILAAASVFSYAKTEKGRRAVDELKLRIPLLRTLQLNLSYSQFSRTMATMIEGGIPIMDSLKVVIDSLENKVVADRFSVLPEMLERGLGFAQAMRNIPNTPSMMIRVVQVGEESGRLGEMLENLSEHYDEEISELTDTITAMIEPALFLFMAVVVGTLVIAMLYPVLTAASQIN